MILDDLKNFIIQNTQASLDAIKYDYDCTKGQDVILLTLYDSLPCDMARRSSVRISIKFSDLKLARDTCFTLHDLLFPEDGFQKSTTINNKIMHIKLNKGPFYAQKDRSKRHIYILDITLTHNR